MSHIMLDLETLGTDSDAVIMSIGAVSFNDDGIHGEFYCNIDIQSCLDAGLSVTGRTIEWWLNQDDNARGALNRDTVTIKQALITFSKWYLDHTGYFVWGNSSTFDNVIIKNAYKAVGIDPPWEFWKDQCYRTIKFLNEDIGFERVGVHHNAVDDAKSQALHLIKILNKGK